MLPVSHNFAYLHALNLVQGGLTLLLWLGLAGLCLVKAPGRPGLLAAGGFGLLALTVAADALMPMLQSAISLEAVWTVRSIVMFVLNAAAAALLALGVITGRTRLNHA